jgi:CTP synthase
MQLVLIESARNLLGIEDANSTEFDQETKNPIIVKMDEWIGLNNKKEDRRSEEKMGGTMRIGAYECVLKKDSLAYKIYDEKERIFERHRHRYEVNNEYIERLEGCGLFFSGVSSQENLMEIVEMKDHPFFIAVQFHPEFQTSVLKGHPIFNAFIKFIRNSVL